jgi:glycosyltransferase involved in cell wall biosynthesis
MFSVIICTHNRVTYLEKALAGVAKQCFPTDRFEVIVVDNASSDGTRHCVEKLQGANFPIRYIYEKKLGLSIARNTGWNAARAQYIAYLDDDAVPDEGWLSSAAETIETGPQDIGILGGQVLPIWESERPDWLSDRMLSLLSMVDLGVTSRYVDEDFGIVGANMIIPRHLLEQYGGFSSEVGRIGSLLLSGEETLLKRRFAEAGYRGFYSPRVSVRHHAPAERLSKKWFLERMYWQGRSGAALMRLEHEMPWQKRVANSGLELLKAGVLNVAGRISSQGFDLRVRAQGHLGMAEGLYRGGVSH